MQTINTTDSILAKELRGSYEHKQVSKVTKVNHGQKELFIGLLCFAAIITICVVIGSLTNTY